ncbi:MAG: uncharacterized protein KVP18_000478 [Porospora cf. gigantea A]|uniref:uncharacterized protein n=1 Tax=Porospora cf. gigantea A TaxID=2853593 RepID=UPI003559F1DD|nr:MAG: hypothetical protein KVP18_000478 [Porospora cf. gigantea A]
MAPMMSSMAPSDPHAVHETSAVRSVYPSTTGSYPVMNQGRMPTGIYQPNGTLYVGSGQPLRGGMTPIYERHIVPTFEAPLEWRVGAEHIDSFVDTTISPPVRVAERGASSSSSSSDHHEHTKRQRACCNSHNAAAANSRSTKRQSGCCKPHTSPSKSRRHKSKHAKSKRSKCC